MVFTSSPKSSASLGYIDHLGPHQKLASIPRDRLSPSEESRRWIDALNGERGSRESAIAELHDLLFRAARYEVNRRRSTLVYLHGEELEDIAHQAADDALVAILAKLDDFRGASRFTTWAYKFALLEVGVKLRRRLCQSREIVLQPERRPTFLDGSESPQEQAEHRELIDALRLAVSTTLTPHQRNIFVFLALNDVPIDVLAERLNTTRGALYKTLHDARRKLRIALQQAGELPPED